MNKLGAAAILAVMIAAGAGAFFLIANLNTDTLDTVRQEDETAALSPSMDALVPEEQPAEAQAAGEGILESDTETVPVMETASLSEEIHEADEGYEFYIETAQAASPVQNVQDASGIRNSGSPYLRFNQAYKEQYIEVVKKLASGFLDSSTLYPIGFGYWTFTDFDEYDDGAVAGLTSVEIPGISSRLPLMCIFQFDGYNYTGHYLSCGDQVYINNDDFVNAVFARFESRNHNALVSYINLLTPVLELNCGKRYSITRNDSNIITIAVWRVGVANIANNAAYLVPGQIEAWNAIVNSFQVYSQTAYAAMRGVGISNGHVMVTLLNDTNTENELLSYMDGKQIYNFAEDGY